MTTDRLNATEFAVNWPFILRVVIKAAFLFLLINLAFLAIEPIPALGRVTLYNHLVPGRLRLPYSDDPERSFNMSIPQLEAMFASHEIGSAAKAPDEYRVLMIGDSSIWGFLLHPDETVAARLDAKGLTTADGRTMRVYNLGYPTMSVTKDLLLLDRALDYGPDLILWFVTLESLPWPKQLTSPLLELNPEATVNLARKTGLSLDLSSSVFRSSTPWEKTLLGQRRALADWLRFQLYGFAWAATSVDHVIPETYNQRMEDLPAETAFQSYAQGALSETDLAFDVFRAGIEAAGDVPVILINEPMFVSTGENSDIRYNFYYPRWAYDAYHEWILETVDVNGWRFADLWDALPGEEFTDSAIHYTPQGAQILADLLARQIVAAEIE